MQLLPLPDGVRQYLHLRGITDQMITTYKLGYTEKGSGNGWITIPVKTADGGVFHKLRAVPGNSAPNKYAYDPAGSGAELYGRGVLALPGIDRVVICEGEFDAMLLNSHNIAAVTSTSGVQSFKEEWCDLFPINCHVVLCFDHDPAGDKGREKVRTLFRGRRPDCVLQNIRFSDFDTKGFDVSDFFQHTGEDGFAPSLLKRITDEAEEEKDGEAGIREEGALPNNGQHEEGYQGHGEDPGNRDANPSGPLGREETGTISGSDEAARAQATGPQPRPKFAKLTCPVEPIEIDTWKQVVKGHFPKLIDTAEICASVVAQLLLKDVYNPFSLFITDRPGSGKTICINFFRGLDELTYFTSDFTPASFVTSIAGRTPKQLEQIDLLPKIRWKTLLVKDLAPLLSDNDDVLRKHLGMLTDILDGEGYTKESGVHGSRGYEGDYIFMFLAATTPFAPRVWKLMTGMGHRFFFLGLNSKRKRIDELKAQLQSKNFKVKERECKEATHEFLKTLWSRNPEGVEWDGAHDEDLVIDYICMMADFLSLFRGDIFVHEERWTDGKTLGHTEPKIEDASRINQCLYNLCRGHAVLHGRTALTMDDVWVAVRVCLDTAPNPRPMLFRELLRSNGTMSIGDVAECLGMSINTAKKEIHKLCALGVCESDLLKKEAKNEAGEWVDWEGQARITMTLKEEFKWWLELIKTQKRESGESTTERMLAE